MNKTRIKDFIIGGVLGLFILGGVAGASSEMKWILGTNGSGQSIITSQVNLPIGITMQTPNLATAVGTTTAGTLSTSSVVSSIYIPGATSSQPTTYYFELAANDVLGGQTTVGPTEYAVAPSSTAANNEVILTWGAIPGAKYYDVYAGTSSQAEYLLATTTALTYTLSTTTATSSTGLLIAYPQSFSTGYVDTINPNGKSYLGGDLQVVHLNGNNVATVATGTGAGSTATYTLAYATDLSGVITIHTGANVTGTAPLFTVTYGESYAKAPACIIAPQNANAAALVSSSTPYMVPSTTSSVAEANALSVASATTYTWNWVCSN